MAIVKAAGKDSFALALVTVLLVTIMSRTVNSQNCGCPSDLCCSKWGYCGNSADYCGSGCREGPCWAPSGGDGGAGGDEAVPLDGTVTSEFFNGIISQASDDCAGKRFYSRDAFLEAAGSYGEFGSSISKREIAAFFAHVTHETGFMCYIEEIDGPSKDYCDEGNTDFPCAQGKGYYGRGPIQLSWNYNYGLCGRDLGLDLLGSPETVAQDPVVAFKTAFWFWTSNVRGDLNEGFGATIRAINGMECDGGNPAAVSSRVEYYKDLCLKLGVDPGDNLSC